MKAKTFQIKVPQKTLTDLRKRLANTRWPDEIEGAGWEYGTNLAYLKELVDYWQNDFDWREQEAMLNKFPQFKTEIDGMNVHFVHVKGKGPNPTPLLLVHGWPDSFYRFYKIIPMLTDPEKYGGKAEDSFDVIVPSIPGFGFSDRPTTKGFTHENSAELFFKLMTQALGYEKFAAHGGDTGSPIVQAIATSHPKDVVGIHLTDIGYDKAPMLEPSTLSEAEKAYVQTLEQWSYTEGAYVMIQGTKPQSLAYGFNDSPTALAAWIVEQFRKFSDCNGDIESRFSKDELLTNIMIYWVTETMNSAMRGYYEGMHAAGWGEEESEQSWSEEKGEQSSGWGEPSEGSAINGVPVGLALFPKDAPPPREMAERFFNVQRFTEMPTGGHFAALEEPELLVQDLQAFFREFCK
jgi:pimeloyl-ACP methyl ester carboxylesterase